MVEIFMLTIPRLVHKRILKLMIERNDVKEWVIGRETGKDGYEHWQVRLSTSNRDFFTIEEVKINGEKIKIKTGWIARNIPTAHCEVAQDVWDYEKKGGDYWTSEDTADVLKVRFGKPTQIQHCILKIVRDQNDREIDVFLDKKGGTGKTFLSQMLWERGLAYYVPRSVSGGGKVSADCCTNCGTAKYIILDVQRDKGFDKDFYADLEELKDGLVSDPRFTGKQRNLRGRKLIVFTNKEMDLEKLSKDRWRLHGCTLISLEEELHRRKIVKNVRNVSIL